MSNLFNKDIGGRQFNFQPYNVGHENGYHVDVKDEDGTRWEFRMSSPENKDWVLRGEKLPVWITDLKQEIIKAISDHE